MQRPRRDWAASSQDIVRLCMLTSSNFAGSLHSIWKCITIIGPNLDLKTNYIAGYIFHIFFLFSLFILTKLVLCSFIEEIVSLVLRVLRVAMALPCSQIFTFYTKFIYFGGLRSSISWMVVSEILKMLFVLSNRCKGIQKRKRRGIRIASTIFFSNCTF